MKTITHFCVDIEGAINRLQRSNKKYSEFDDENGNPVPRKAAILNLKYELNKGRKVLPMSKNCVGFDYQTGCPGHEKAEYDRSLDLLDGEDNLPDGEC